MILLSYSTIKSTIDCNKYYLNHKILGTPKLEFDYFAMGKEAHRVIQDHVSGVKEDPRLVEAGVSLPEFHFPIVETVDKDPKTMFEVKFNDKYSIYGFLDGMNPEWCRMLEIKTGTKPWSFKQFLTSNQRKIYVWATDYKEMIGITANRDLSVIKKFSIPSSEKDKDDAIAFIQKGIDIIEEGNFDGGENVNCPRCVFRDHCQWRQC